MLKLTTSHYDNEHVQAILIQRRQIDRSRQVECHVEDICAGSLETSDEKLYKRFV